MLSTDDPVRVYQQFATLDALSNGRAEITAGRGSSTESFPLFGYSFADYDELYAEKLDLLLKINESNPVTWRGKHRPPLENAWVVPRPETGTPADLVGHGRESPLFDESGVSGLADFLRHHRRPTSQLVLFSLKLMWTIRRAPCSRVPMQRSTWRSPRRPRPFWVNTLLFRTEGLRVGIVKDGKVALPPSFPGTILATR